jgi:hypothetical protein
MAKQSLQEKFQASYPYKDEDGENWVWAKDGALRPRGVSGGFSANSENSELTKQARIRRPPNARVASNMEVGARNDPPRRTDLNEWVMPENGGMDLVTAAETDVSKVQSPKALKNGFTLHGMKSTDDQYTGENMDHFYGEAIGDDDAGNRVEGFVERNNYLDRI